MSDDENIAESIFEVEGVAAKVMTAVSNDRKRYELCIICAGQLDPVFVAKILEVVGSKMIKDIYIPPQIYAKEMI